MGEVALGRMELLVVGFRLAVGLFVAGASTVAVGDGAGKKGLTMESGGAMSARRDVKGQFTAAAGNSAASRQRGSRGLA